MRVDVHQIAAGALRQLPETFDPAWLKHAWAGEHGTLSMHASMSETASAIQLRADELKGTSGATGTVLLGDRKAGVIERHVALKPDGQLHAVHSKLSLSEFAQRKGFATGLNEASYDRYRAAGIDAVTLTAGLDAGGYVWARSGFELHVPGAADPAALGMARAHNVRWIVDDAYEHGAITRDELRDVYRRVLRGDESRLRPDTITGVAQLAELPIGKRLLKGRSWEGIRHLETPLPWATRVDSSPAAGIENARAGIDALLPDGLSPARLGAALVQATADLPVHLRAHTGRTAATAHINFADRQVRTSAAFTAVNRAGTRVGDYELDVSAHGGGLLALRTTAPIDPAAGAALDQHVDDALAEVGVETMTTRERRGNLTLPSSTYSLG